MRGTDGIEPALDFHHFGVACRNLDEQERVYAVFGYTRERDDFTDPIQGVSGRFLVGGGPRMELLVALENSSVLDPWLANGPRIYHQAFETPNLASSLQYLDRHGFRTIVGPVPAVAFSNRLIAFAMNRRMTMIELIEYR